MRCAAAILLVIGPVLTARALEAPPAVGVGSLLQQVQPSSPALAAPETRAPAIDRQDSQPAPAAVDSIPIPIRKLVVLGNTLFPTEVLHALVADAEGQALTLDQLDQVAARIGRFYNEQGYPFARAVTPAQVIRDGVVRIVVIEARYGRVGIDNQTRVSDLLLRQTAAALQEGAPVAQKKLDEALLLLSDIPGIAVSATLKPGAQVGTSDLAIVATPAAAVLGSLTLDNHGNPYTGRTRIGATLGINNPVHHGDVASVNLLSSGTGLNYGRLAYETLVNGSGLRLGAAYSQLDYKLGGALASLEASGSAKVASLWLRHPLIRQPDSNLYGQLQYDTMALREHIDSSAIRTDRSLDSLTAGLAGDWRDTLWSGGINSWSAGWTLGKVGFDDAAAQLNDDATARTRGGFAKFSLAFSRQQNLAAGSLLMMTLAGQWASANLDPSQKMSIGGPYSVRAYEVGALSGDAGYRGSLEWRHELGQWGNGSLQSILFVDSAYLVINRSPWASGINHATLSGTGLGLQWTGLAPWQARFYAATPIGPAPALIRSTDAFRIWTELAYRF